ncbi:GDSL-type esterase/lipase family protein [Luteitalea sp. TBR-22]|uniref:GDSL-type esterase/lipase family protein n=1 Tax=Luteitalea sp. TBR-22 TaxID=2802971 RepID=UPI001EF64AE0|nr:GDSL-type esterase/lipase family protein [Luteitalea sp. TBR-22]
MLRVAALFVSLLVVVVPVAAQDASRWFLAEGASNAVLEEEILVANPTALTLAVTVRLLPDASAVIAPGAVLSKTFPLGPTSRLTVRVAQELPGLNGAASAEVSATVANSTTPADIVVERSMYFPDGTRLGAHNASGVTQAEPRWILAEGASGAFSTFILVANPNTSSTTVRVRYLKSTGEVITFTQALPPSSRTTFWPQNDYPTQLGSAEFSTVVESLEAGEDIVAERAMYFDPSTTGSGFARSGHDALGVPEASNTWYFAEGFTGGNATTAFETFLLLANPSDAASTATVTYQLDSGQTVARTYPLGPNQRLTIWVDQEGREADARLKAASFGMTVTATRPIVAERAMYWGTPSAADPSTPTFPWREGHATAGSTVLSPKWAFAEGRDGVDAGNRPYSTFFLLSNPSNADVTVKATFMAEDGGGLTSTVVVPARGRANIWPTAALPEFAALANRRFATFLESTGGASFVAERAVYLYADFASGHVNMGTPWTGAIVSPSRAPGAVTVTGYTPREMRLSGGELITITGTGFAGTPEVTVDGLAATIQSATATQITALAPLRTALTGFGTLAASTIRLTTAGTTQTVGTFTRRFRVLAMGDSMTYGTIVEYAPPVPPSTTPTRLPAYQAALPYPAGLQGLLRADARFGSGATVDNEGYSGECVTTVGCSSNTTRGVDRIVTLVAAKKYDVVVILEGFNDQNATVFTGTTIANGLRTMGRAARDSGATVVMGRIHVMRSDLWSAIATMATEEKFLRVDFDTRVEIGEDGVHPTQNGYDQMASFVYGAIKAAIK